MLARALEMRQIKVFLDDFQRSELWGADLVEHLYNVYSSRATFCVILASSRYVAAQKQWTHHELKAAQEKQSKFAGYILPIKLDGSTISGLPSKIGYLDLKQVSLEAVADLLRQKLDVLYRKREQGSEFS